MQFRDLMRRGALALCLAFAGLAPALAEAPAKIMDAAALADQRDETLAYSAGVQAYIYGYPAVDFRRVMREQTTKGMDRAGVYAPINRIVHQDGLAKPGGIYAGPGAEHRYDLLYGLARSVARAGGCSGAGYQRALLRTDLCGFLLRRSAYWPPHNGNKSADPLGRGARLERRGARECSHHPPADASGLFAGPRLDARTEGSCGGACADAEVQHQRAGV
jgi:hypothetical protein